MPSFRPSSAAIRSRGLLFATLLAAGLVACGSPPRPRSALAPRTESPLGPSYVLLPLPTEDTSLLGRILPEPPQPGRALEETARPNPCAEHLASASTTPLASVFESAEEFSARGAASATLASFGFRAQADQATHFVYTLRAERRTGQVDTIEYQNCCREKDCGYGYVSALVYGRGTYATGEETRASGEANVLFAGGGGAVSLRLLEKRDVAGWFAAVVRVNRPGESPRLGPLGGAEIDVEEPTVPDRVKALYARGAVRVEPRGDGFVFVAGSGAQLTENEFVRRFREQAGSDELDDLERRRNTPLLVTSGAGAALAVGTLAYGLATLRRPCERGDFDGDPFDSCSRDVGAFETEFNPAGRTTDGLGLALTIAGGVGSLVFVPLLVFGLVDYDGSPEAHYLGEREATLYADRHNRALLRRTLREVERSRQDELSRIPRRPSLALRLELAPTSLRLGGRFW